MAVYKDGDKWRVIYRYTNYKGERKQTQKRGFATKREAQAWEREVMLKSESKSILVCCMRLGRMKGCSRLPSRICTMRWTEGQRQQESSVSASMIFVTVRFHF